MTVLLRTAVKGEAPPRLPHSHPGSPPVHMRSLALALALACLLALALAQTSSDPCAFSRDSSYTGVWVTNRSAILNCFNSVTFSSTNLASLVSILNYTWGGFTFHDYLSEPIAPYNVQVRHTFEDPRLSLAIPS